METITFACPACKHTLKVGADKAGRKAKCNKCGNPLTIPAAVAPPPPIPQPALAPVGPPKAEAGPALATTEPPPFKYVDDDTQGPKTFEFKDEPVPAAEEG